METKKKIKKWLKYIFIFFLGLIIGLAWLWYSTSTTYDGAFDIGYDYGWDDGYDYGMATAGFFLYQNCIYHTCKSFKEVNLYDCGGVLNIYTSSNNWDELDKKFNDSTIIDKIPDNEFLATGIAEITCDLILLNKTTEAPILEVEMLEIDFSKGYQLKPKDSNS